ncbi:unnamed protein product [Ambrosiozyma monospora]|uniref:Unnamed protein product n=1 Tax=Ambrosiozyma monospora TaxID=43982 RepID=A0A9W6T1A1_AMBMO|nr:unnamed protein product [Ambrosiozyma monospora]
MNNMNTKNPASWIKFISHIPLASLQVRSRSLGGRYGEKQKVQKLQLISFLLKQYKPIEFGIYESTADFSHLLQYDYNWVGRITTLRDFPASDIEALYQQIGRFKRLQNVQFRLSWTFFRSGSVNSKLVKFIKLLELIDKMVFILVIYDRQIVDFEVENGFLTFFKKHRNQSQQKDPTSSPKVNYVHNNR